MSWSLVSLLLLPAASLDSELDRLCNAVESERPMAVVKMASALLAGQEGALAQADQALARRRLPPLREALTQSRLDLRRWGQDKQLPAPGLAETQLLLETLEEMAQSLEGAIRDHALLQDELPQQITLQEFAASFDAISRLRGQTEDLVQRASLMRDIVARIGRDQRRQLNSVSDEIVAYDLAGVTLATARRLERELLEREAELHQLRIQAARRILAQPGPSPDHIRAAAAIPQDIQLLRAFFKQLGRTPANRATLRDPQLLREATMTANAAIRDAGPLTQKAALFAAGLEWWSRGRYGLGTELQGLAKNALAKREPLHPTLLDVPRKSPVPTNPHAVGQPRQTQLPMFDRRHHYWWAVGDRDVSESNMEISGTAVTTLDYFEQRGSYFCGSQGTRAVYLGSSTSVTPTVTRLAYRELQNDDSELLQLVGFAEYRQALQYWDTLLKNASLPELDSMDAIVKADPQYRIYTNLSRRFPQARKSAFPLAQAPVDSESGEQGLDWLIALARVELLAFVAGYTDADQPLTIPGRDAYDAEPFQELLLDAALSHYWSLQNDAALRQLTRLPKQRLLAYERRISMARKLTEAAGRMGYQTHNALQRAELKQAERDLAQLSKLIRKDLLDLGLSQQ